ncbi:MAG: HD domain-containing phosphohydrolase [Myxococcota bacterium]
MGKTLGERLVESGLVTADAIEQALQQQKITGHRLGDCLVEIGLLPETTLLRFLAEQLKTRFVTSDKLAKAKIPPEVLEKVPVRMAEAQVLLPLALDQERKILSLVMAEPQNTAVIEEISLVTGMKEVYAFVGLRSAIWAAIKKHYYGDPTAFAQLAQGGAQAPRTDPAAAGAYDSGRTESKNLPGGTMPDTVVRPSGISTNRGSPLPLSAARGAGGENDFLAALTVLVGLLETGRKDLRGHSEQLGRQCATIARCLGLQPPEIAQVSIACCLHDLGKSYRHFTLAGTAHNPELRAEATRFLKAPIKLFETVHLAEPVNTMLGQLYEAYDGSGMPHGAKGEEISAGARILAAVDSYLELTKNSQNPFGRLFTKDEALGYLTQKAGTLFDPLVVDALRQLHCGALLRQWVEADGRQVLIADPEDAVRTDLKEALARHQVVVHTVSKLDGTGEALVRGEADLLVAGLRFGLTDLVTLVEFLRAQPECAGAPVVVVGEPPDQAGKERLLGAGVSAIIPMPLQPDEAASDIVKLYRDHIRHGDPGRPVRGNFDELAASELFKVLAQGRKSGRLTIRNGVRDGYLHFEKGRAVYASCAGDLGEPALAAMLSSPCADFVYDPESLLTEVPHLDKDLEEIAKELYSPAG